MRGDDKVAIEARLPARSQPSTPLAPKPSPVQAARAGAEGASAKADGDAKTPGDDVVDAEFEEVKDNK